MLGSMETFMQPESLKFITHWCWTFKGTFVF